MKRSKTHLLLASVFLLSVLFLAGSPALAGDPLCWTDCNITFYNCSDAAGCQPPGCADGSHCRDGRCEDGNYCTAAVACDNTHCYEDRSLCLLGCRDWWFPQLNLVTTLNIPESVRQEITVELDSLRQEIELGVEQIENALQNRLENYRVQVESLRQNQALDDATANSLISISNQVESSLEREDLLDHVMTEPNH